MKTSKVIFGLLSAFLLSACNSSVLFLQPQPTGITSLQEFPREFLGVYINGNDQISVSKKYVTAYDFKPVAMPLKVLDTSIDYRLQGSRLFLPNRKSINVTFRNDSLFGSEVQVDTVFSLTSGTQELKLMDGALFLSTWEENGWSVYKASLAKQTSGEVVLALANINLTSEWSILTKNFVILNTDSSQGELSRIWINPTNQEFKGYLSLSNAFSEQQFYTKRVK